MTYQYEDVGKTIVLCQGHREVLQLGLLGEELVHDSMDREIV